MADRLQVRIVGADRAIRDLDRALNAAVMVTDRNLALSARDIEQTARRLCPVDTGRLRNSIRAIKSGELAYTVEAGEDYAVYVEFGTSKMAAQPFMVPAVEMNRQDVVRRVRRGLQTLRVNA